MPYIYENDVTQTGGNLQKTVAYLLSLHKNEYEWNLLGIKVVGHVDALPIPDSDYEYGDAYTVGTTTPYDMWIYTRADTTHPQDYWFNVGKFPAPGPQGPVGPSLIDVTDLQMDAVQRVDYDATTGADVESAATLKYKDPNTGEVKQETIDTMKIKLPIVAGDDVGIDANADGDALTIKVDEMELAQKFFKIDKTSNNIPVVKDGVATSLPWSTTSTPNSVVVRDANKRITVYAIESDSWVYSSYIVSFFDLYYNTKNADYIIDKTTSDTGKLTVEQLESIKISNRRIIYDDQVYYRMDPQSAPDGTLNYIHIDGIQDENGGYKATGKCFSVTVSTREWQVVDLDVAGNTRTTHNLTITYSQTGTTIYFSLTNNRPETYEGAPVGLWSALENSPIACTVDSNGFYSAGMITIDGNNFRAIYGKSEELLMEQELIGILDNMV